MDEQKAVVDALMEVLGLAYESKRDPVKIVNAASRAVLAERERCLKAVEVEEELPGTMPEENWVMSQKVRLEDHLRATVRSTKTNIIGRMNHPAS